MSALKPFQLLPYLSWESHYIFLHLIKSNSQKPSTAHTWATIKSTIIISTPCIMISSYGIWGVVHLTFICRQHFLMSGSSEQGGGVHMPSLCSLISLLFQLLLKMYENKSIAKRDSPATEFYVPVLRWKECFCWFYLVVFFSCPIGKIIPFQVKFSRLFLCATGIFRSKRKVIVISQYI